MEYFVDLFSGYALLVVPEITAPDPALWLANVLLMFVTCAWTLDVRHPCYSFNGVLNIFTVHLLTDATAQGVSRIVNADLGFDTDFVQTWIQMRL